MAENRYPPGYIPLTIHEIGSSQHLKSNGVQRPPRGERNGNVDGYHDSKSDDGGNRRGQGSRSGRSAGNRNSRGARRGGGEGYGAHNGDRQGGERQGGERSNGRARSSRNHRDDSAEGDNRGNLREERREQRRVSVADEDLE